MVIEKETNKRIRAGSYQQTKKTHRREKRTITRLLPWVSFVCVLILCTCVLFFPEPVGLSDNGDFGRIFYVNNMRYSDAADNNYLFKRYYTMDVAEGGLLSQIVGLMATSEDQVSYSSPHFVFVKAAKLLNFFSNRLCGYSIGNFDIVWLALLYIAVLAAAAFLIVKFFGRYGWIQQVCAMGLFLFLFCDMGYLLYFNSLYGEAVQFFCLLLLIGAGLQLVERQTVWRLLLFYVTLYFFAGAKLSNVPFAVVIALISAIASWKAGGRKKAVWFTGLSAACILACGVLYFSVPGWMNMDTSYQSVFFGVLKDSPTPEQDLRDLGIDEKYAVLAGTHIYMDNYPVDIHSEQFKQDFFNKISRMDVVRFYLTHPGRLFEKLAVSVEESAYLSPPYLGNSQTERMVHAARWNLWSRVRIRTGLLHNAPFILCLLCLLAAVCVWLVMVCIRNWKKISWRRMAAYSGIWMLTACLWLSLALPMAANGEADIGKHMFLFSSLVDVLFAAAVMVFAVNYKAVIRYFVRHERVALYSSVALLVCAICVAAVAYVSRPRVVEFGRYHGNSVQWEVLSEDSETMTLVSKSCVAAMSFEQGNGTNAAQNVWSSSTLRSWLNSVFLEEFSTQEREKLIAMQTNAFLPGAMASQSDGGSHPKFWTANPKAAYGNGEDAYYQTSVDLVRTVSLRDVQEGKFTVSVNRAYWLVDAYGGNSTMERCIDENGYALFQDTGAQLGVRPVITVKK